MKLQKILVLGILLSFLLTIPTFAKQGNGAVKQTIGVYAANNLGQTLDNTKSFVIVRCDGTGTLRVNGHLQKTNQAGNLLNVWISMDGCGYMMVASFTPNVEGNGDFQGVMTCNNQPTCCSTSCCSGSHSVVVAINTAPAPGATLYITTPIQLECP